MTVLSGNSIKRAGIISPFYPRTRDAESRTTYGVSFCGYDIRLDQTVILIPGRTILASSHEYFSMPDNVVGTVHDKSTWARLGISVQNTVIEPGWCGYLTLELLYSPLYTGGLIEPFMIKNLSPIAQILFHTINESTEGYGNGKYQNQERGPQEAR